MVCSRCCRSFQPAAQLQSLKDQLGRVNADLSKVQTELQEVMGQWKEAFEVITKTTTPSEIEKLTEDRLDSRVKELAHEKRLLLKQWNSLAKLVAAAEAAQVAAAAGARADSFAGVCKWWQPFAPVFAVSCLQSAASSYIDPPGAFVGRLCVLHPRQCDSDHMLGRQIQFLQHTRIMAVLEHRLRRSSSILCL